MTALPLRIPGHRVPVTTLAMILLVLATLALTLPGVTRAAPPQNPEQVNGMIDNIKAFHEEGLALRERYDLSDDEQRKTCQEQQQDKAEEARALRGQAAKLPDLAYRVNLTMAANDALACVSCDTKEGACKGVPAALERVRKQMEAPGASDGGPARASE